MSVNDLRSSLRRSQVVTNQIICSARYKRFPWCPNWDSHRTDLTLLLELWDPPTKEERLCKLDETYSAVLSADGVTLNRLLASLREGTLRGSPSTLPTSQAQASWTIDEAEQHLSLCALDRHDTLVGALNDELRLVARGAAFGESITETGGKSDVS
jgi:hypothetical protein